MSKQAQLFDPGPLTDWALVYRIASARDRQIVDFVQLNPGATRGDIVAGTGIPGRTLDFRLWELSGRSTGEHRSDGLLIATRSGPEGQQVYRYTARER